ncbi:hypothetical protein [Lentilactobacillus sp. Marseille-Q4993]|uniref:hypothetical protein n=1 Tax=Lentilactobacillus sp. Marseille-Q4993 TaxID=3039492 RepID=UPI0024BD5C95|nr:hypothetical protein [Lentilactobacillus sp. Marseille-Q4993]
MDPKTTNSKKRNKNNPHRLLRHLIIIFFVLTALIAIIMPFMATTNRMRTLFGVSIIVLVIAVCIISFVYLTRTVPHDSTGIIIPKQHGTGITINPHSFGGKLIWLLIFVVLLATMVVMVIK